MADSERKTTVAVQALILACRLEMQTRNPKHLKKALERLGEDHAADKGIFHALTVVFQTGQPQTADFFRTVIAKNQDRKTRGFSTYLLAVLLNGDDGKNEAEAVRLLETCMKDYRDVKLEQNTLADMAKPLLHKIRFLSVGKTVPEITGEDPEGKKFKLSDYRGKVVLVDFFADWCPHCERMYPHERKLVTDYAKRPFALLGVNCDKGKDTVKQLVASNKVTWRCWWDEGGRLAQDWQIDGYPTLYLVDHKGVIREIFGGRPEDKKLDEAIKRCVEAAEKKP
jgi:thiol-disulfide isomerase/thioredoxin